MSTEAVSAQEHGLRRELRFWEAIALSIGIMAPIVLLVPGLARRIGANLAEREGLALEERPGL